MDSKTRTAVPHTWVVTTLAALMFAAILGLSLAASGRTLWCSCRSLLPWSFEVMSLHNSQHLVDWYTPSHVLHGILLYWVCSLFFKKLSIQRRFLVVLLFEAVWEYLENSPFIIDRYRSATIALDYYGDSILNSLSDYFSCAIGFLLARTLAVRTSIAFCLVAELTTLWFIRDNLTLNIIMLLWPIEEVRQWQSAGNWIL